MRIKQFEDEEIWIGNEITITVEEHTQEGDDVGPVKYGLAFWGRKNKEDSSRPLITGIEFESVEQLEIAIYALRILENSLYVNM